MSCIMSFNDSPLSAEGSFKMLILPVMRPSAREYAGRKSMLPAAMWKSTPRGIFLTLI